jgi:glycerol-3-phosphate dehydrogenase
MRLPGVTRRSLESERFHVIVVGGGINGVAVARECARAGKRTLLVEQSDFGSGTTSRSTRLLQGGIQSLRQGEISFMRESLREQKHLLRQHPHLVHPTRVVLAIEENGRTTGLRLKAGLWLYRRLAGNKNTIDGADFALRNFERQLDSGKHWTVSNCEDAQCEFPERMVAEWLADAVEAGAVVRNHTEVLAVNVFHGRVKGLLMRDLRSGKEDPVEANWIINATGPWADRLCQRSRIAAKSKLVTGIRGSHLVLPRFPGFPEAAVYSQHEDGTPLFVTPWNEQILVGSTAVSDSTDPGAAEPSDAEIQYLMQGFGRLFPKSKLSGRDIHYAFAGVRAQPFSSNKNLLTPGEKCYVHNHKEDGAAQMLSVIGGSLISAAQLGRECAETVGAKAKTPGTVTAVAPDGVDPLLDQWVLEVAGAGGISEASARGIVEWFGKRSPAVAQLATSSVQMRAPLCPHTDHIVAEAIFALSNENAVTLADVLLRRVPVALGRCWSEACSRDAALRIAAVLGWTQYETAAELEEFEAERARFLHRPGRSQGVLEAAAD